MWQPKMTRKRPLKNCCGAVCGRMIVVVERLTAIPNPSRHAAPAQDRPAAQCVPWEVQISVVWHMVIAPTTVVPTKNNAIILNNHQSDTGPGLAEI